jgi:hypothetical protein
VPQDNVEVVRELIAKWNAGVRDLDLISEHLDPAIELESPFSTVAGEPYRGYAGIEQWMRDVDDQFADWTIDVEDASAAKDRVIAIATVRARGRASGAPLQFDAATVCDLASDHRVTRIHIYLDVQTALKAVGLEE